jgi:5-methylcytosine-specific restriction endonuclease McrA
MMHRFTTAPDIRGHECAVKAFEADGMKVDLPDGYIVFDHYYDPRRPVEVDGSIYAPEVGTIVYPTSVGRSAGGLCYFVLAKHRNQRTYFNGDYDVSSDIICVETQKTPKYRTVRHIIRFVPKTKKLIFEKTKKERHKQPPSMRLASFKRKNALRRATPIWCDKRSVERLKTKVRSLNKEAGFIKFHVDHIIPLQGESICGLHVPWNLQVITAEENLRKSNKWETN